MMTTQSANRVVAILAVVVAALLLPAAAGAFTGQLWSTSSGILGTGSWITPGPAWIEWNVTQNPDDSWLYSYDFHHPESATSHFILEVSESFTVDDIIRMQGNYSGYELKEHLSGPGNPNMPGSIYGIKFDNAWGVDSHFELTTMRTPVWGDFYAKGGATPSRFLKTAPRRPVHCTAWNAGFDLADPVVPAADGSMEFHLLVPDTNEPPPVPEPSTMLLMSSGLLGMAYVWRRRK